MEAKKYTNSFSGEIGNVHDLHRLNIILHVPGKIIEESYEMINQKSDDVHKD